VPGVGPFARQIRAGLAASTWRLAREVDTSPCEQGGAGQSLAGTLVGEKNRCLPISAPDVRSAPFQAWFWNLAGTISGTILGTIAFASVMSFILRILVAVRWPRG